MVRGCVVLSLFVMFQARLHAGPMTHIEAHQVDYDGKQIHLVGKVHLSHEFGEITCAKAAVLLMPEQHQSLTPQRILLQEDVCIKLKDGSQIESDEADIDCQRLEGVFTAAEPKKVMYCTFLQEGKGQVPVKASSRAMKVAMKKSETSSTYEIRDVQAEGAVQIEYQNSLATQKTEPHE